MRISDWSSDVCSSDLGELTIRPATGLTLAANALWLKTRINDYDGTNAAGQPENFDGAEFIYSPEFQGSVTLAYDTPVSDTFNLTAAASARYQSKSHTIFEDLALYRVHAYGHDNADICPNT